MSTHYVLGNVLCIEDTTEQKKILTQFPLSWSLLSGRENWH